MNAVIILLLQILAFSTIIVGSELLYDGYEGFAEVNVALRGKATLSSPYLGNGGAFSAAGNAIDGNRECTFLYGSCFHTNNHQPWWRVDLLQPYLITSVTITNRGDCCGERALGAVILVGNSLEKNGLVNPRCDSIGSLKVGETKTFKCQKPMLGRYVTVFLPRREYLHLCEVEVNALLPLSHTCG